MLLEELTGEYLGENVRRVVVGGHVAHLNLTRATHFTHLEQLAVDVPGMLRGSVTVAQVVSPLVVSAHVNRSVYLVA
eukprot:scaffold69726_cov72-Phaeocystis_antarctica.AAC.1